MYPLTELEEHIYEYQTRSALSYLTDNDLAVLEDIEREQSGGFKRRLAAAFVEIGIKIHPKAAIHHAASHEAA